MNSIVKRCVFLALAVAVAISCQAPKQEGDYTSREPIPTSAGLDVAVTITEERFSEPAKQVTEGEGFPKVIRNWNTPEMWDYKIGLLDILRIALYYSNENVKYDVTVQRDGTIVLPLIGRFQVLDKSPEEVQNMLNEAFATYYMEPTTEVSVLKNRSHVMYISGMGVHNIEVPLDKRTTLFELMALTGIHWDNMDLRGAYLKRGDKIYPVDLKRLFDGDLSFNYELNDNDILYIRSLDQLRIFLLGEVRKPGEMKMEIDDNLFWALARAGGPNQRAQMHDVRIIRGGLTNPTLITVDIKVLFKRRAPRQINTEDLQRLNVSTQASRKTALALEKLYLQNEDFIFVPKTALAQWNDIMLEISPTLSFLYSQPVTIVRDAVLLESSLAP